MGTGKVVSSVEGLSRLRVQGLVVWGLGFWGLGLGVGFRVEGCVRLRGWGFGSSPSGATSEVRKSIYHVICCVFLVDCMLPWKDTRVLWSIPRIIFQGDPSKHPVQNQYT